MNWLGKLIQRIPRLLGGGTRGADTHTTKQPLVEHDHGHPAVDLSAVVALGMGRRRDIPRVGRILYFLLLGSVSLVGLRDHFGFAVPSGHAVPAQLEQSGKTSRQPLTRAQFDRALTQRSARDEDGSSPRSLSSFREWGGSRVFSGNGADFDSRHAGRWFSIDRSTGKE